MFVSALNDAAEKSKWVRWLVCSGTVAANETKSFLITAFGNIRAEKQNKITGGLRHEKKEENIESIIYELVAHEFLFRLQLQPIFQPNLNGKTPDLLFHVSGMKFISDVFVVHSPSKTVRHGKSGYEAWDKNRPAESRSSKIAASLQSKAESYDSIGLPLVPIVFLGDNYALDFGDVEKACFGITLQEIGLETKFPKNLPRDRVPVGGLLLPRDDSALPYANISAVIACNWFDTVKSLNPGKRLAVVVLHYWSACQPLPLEAFDRLPQVCWDPGWTPRFTTMPNLVLHFREANQIRIESYSATSVPC